jgi:hypothetical protein
MSGREMVRELFVFFRNVQQHFAYLFDWLALSHLPKRACPVSIVVRLVT